MVIGFNEFLSKSKRVDEHQPLVQVEGNAVVALANVLEGIKQYIVSVFVISKFLFLLSNIHSDLHCLFDVANGSVEFKSPLGLFGLVVNLA